MNSQQSVRELEVQDPDNQNKVKWSRYPVRDIYYAKYYGKWVGEIIS